MKKTLGIITLVILFLLGVVGWNIFGPTVNVPDKRFLYVKTGSSYNDVKNALLTQDVLNRTFFFDIIAKQVKYPGNIRAGKYEIKNGMSTVALVRMLKQGRQAPVKLVINKLRTKENLANKIGENFECDSATAIRFLTSNDSLLPYKLDTNTVMTAVIPNTYLMKWNAGIKNIFEMLQSEQQKFWNKERIAKAVAKGFSEKEIYIMASIVEEETNKLEDKKKIASTYINRINKGMKLEADPTVKYAMRAFGLKRILYGHLQFASSYNTYRNKGLPPGPIATPSITTIDAVLDAPDTDYLFFVAKPDFNGYSNFATTYAQHLLYAKAYQKALDSLIISKQNMRP